MISPFNHHSQRGYVLPFVCLSVLLFVSNFS